MSFSGKVVVVTGASSGIGAATAELFAKEGASVALVGRDESRLNSVAQRCATAGNKPLVIKADITKEEEAKTIVKKTVDHFGKLDVLVNNAGIGRNAKIADADILEAFDANINTNLRSIVQLTHLAVPYLGATKGNIVNVSSVAANAVFREDFMPYSVSKSGLDHFTRCVSLELAAAGVRVNGVNPGPVRTDILETSGHAAPGCGDAVWEQYATMTALGRVGEPEEIADLIAFLASDKARSITGSIFVSDNGMLVKRVNNPFEG